MLQAFSGQGPREAEYPSRTVLHYGELFYASYAPLNIQRLNECLETDCSELRYFCDIWTSVTYLHTGNYWYHLLCQAQAICRYHSSFFSASQYIMSFYFNYVVSFFLLPYTRKSSLCHSRGTHIIYLLWFFLYSVYRMASDSFSLLTM